MPPIAPLTGENQYPDTAEGRALMQADLVAAQTMLRDLVWDGAGLNDRYVNRITVHRRASYGQIGVTHRERGSMWDNWDPINERFVGFTQQQLRDIHIALRDGDDAALRTAGFSDAQITQLNANGGRQRHLLLRVADHYGQTANFNATRDRDTSDNWRVYSTAVTAGNDPVEDRPNDRISYADMNLALNDVRSNGGPFADLMSGNNNGFIRSNQYDNPQAAQNATNQLLEILQTGLTPAATAPAGSPKPTLSPAAVAYMNTLFNSTTTPAVPAGADLNRIATETGLPAATITALATYARSVESRNLGKIVTQFLNTNTEVQHIHDNGVGVSGITADDLAGLRAHTTNPRAHNTYNELIGLVNANASTLIRDGGNIPTTQPTAVTPVVVDTEVADGTERSNTPIQLNPTLAGRVNNLRTALMGSPTDIPGVTTALRGSPDAPAPSYREQLQMVREALRATGTPADQVNTMTERQVWDALRTRLGNTNEGVNAYLEFISGGDPTRARGELTTLRADRNLNGYFNQTTPPAVIARIENNTSLTGASAIPRLENETVVNTQTGLLLDSLANQLAGRPTGQQQLTKAQVDGLNGVFQAANSADATRQLTALFPGTENAGLRDYFMGLYNEPRQRRLAGNMFRWMQSNTNPEAQNSIAGIASGTPSRPATVSVTDLRVFSGTLQGRQIGTEEQQNRSQTVLADFGRATEINRNNIFETASTSTSTGGVPAYTAPTSPVASYMPSGSTYINTGMGNMPSFNYSPIATTAGWNSGSMGAWNGGGMGSSLPTFNYFGDSSNITMAYLPSFGQNPASVFSYQGYQPTTTFADISIPNYRSPFIHPYANT